MAKIFIVDDEPMIVESIKSKILRLKFEHIDEIHGCTDSIEAIDVFEKIRPDIAIVDIKMPRVNGIDLINVLSKINTDCKFLILSGYDNFEYVRSAFKVGAVDYLLKPVSMSSLKNAIEQVINKKHSIDDEKDGLKLMDDSEKAGIKELTLMIEQRNICESKKELARKKIIQIMPYNFFVISVLSFDSDEYVFSLKSIENLISDVVHECEFGEFIYRFISDIDNYIVLVFNSSNDVFENHVEFIMKRVVKRIKNDIGFRCICCISKMLNDVMDLNNYFEMLKLIQSYKMMAGYNKIFKLSDFENELKVDRAKIKGIVSEIDKCFFKRSIEGVIAIIEKVFDSNNCQLTISEMKEIYNILIHKLEDIILYNEVSYPIKEFRNFYLFSDINQLKNYLKEITYNVINDLLSIQQKEQKLIDLALEYIKKHSIENITLTDVSDYLNISYSYLSRIFKEQMGMTFSEYMKNLKMDMARQLLKDPRNRISEIAEKIGYESGNHFSRAFKQFFGTSPSSFRKGK